MDANEIKSNLMSSRTKSGKNIYTPSLSITQRQTSNQRIADVKIVFFEKKADVILLKDDLKTLNTFKTDRLKKHHTEKSYPVDENSTNPIEIKEKYNKLYDQHLELISEINLLKNENEKLKLLAYKSYSDLKEESAFEISRVTMEKDSLLILMELRENKKLSYLELRERITRPENLFPRLSELFNINFIALDERSGEFSITSNGIEFLGKRGL